jgi:hypothetical protein
MQFTFPYYPPLSTKLVGSIRPLVATVAPPMLTHVWGEFEYWAIRGTPFEINFNFVLPCITV